jgi:hypothetical protein
MDISKLENVLDSMNLRTDYDFLQFLKKTKKEKPTIEEVLDIFTDEGCLITSLSQSQINPDTYKTFICDYVSQLIPIFERILPTDNFAREIIQTVRNGEDTQQSQKEIWDKINTYKDMDIDSDLPHHVLNVIAFATFKKLNFTNEFDDFSTIKAIIEAVDEIKTKNFKTLLATHFSG